jgi:ubiquinone/menaquinone biosynthesis C-methylase UbiE
MDIQYYEEQWRKAFSQFGTDAEFWDNRADHFNDIARQEKRRQVTELIALLSEKNILASDGAVLDIGCGPGGYSLEMAKVAREVTGLDISARMLVHARRNATEVGLGNVTFMKSNWQETSLEELKWEQRFDLVLAAMSPAITGSAAIQKMMRASRRHCLIGNFVRRGNNLQRHLTQYFSVGNDPHRNDQSVYYLFNILWLLGHHPEIFYFETTREQTLTIAEAVERYQPMLRIESEARDAAGKVLAVEFEKIAHHGMVTEINFAKTAWVYWRVSKKL